MTNIEILDNIELDIDDFFKKKHINAYNIDSWTDKKSERTFNYTYEIKSNKKIDSGALYDYLFSESDILLHNLDMGVKIIPLENTDYYTRVNIIISVPNELAESKKSMKESINGDCYIYYDDNGEIYGKKRRWVFCDNVKGITNTRDFFPLNDFIIDAIHIFKNEKQAQKFIDVDCKYFEDKNKLVIAEYPQTVSGFFESKESARKSIKESSDVADKIASEIDKSYWIDKLIDDLDRHYESMEKAWLKNLDKLSDEDILGIVDDCMGKSKTLVGKSEMLKNKMIDDLSKAYDDYIDDIDRQIRIGKSEDEIKDMIETTLENDIKMYLKLAYNNKASSNYFMVKFAEDNLI